MSDSEENSYQQAYDVIANRLYEETLHFEKRVVSEPFLPSFEESAEDRGHSVYRSYCSDLDELFNKKSRHISIMVTPEEVAHYTEEMISKSSEKKKFHSKRAPLPGGNFEEFTNQICTQIKAGKMTVWRGGKNKIRSSYISIPKTGVLLIYVAYKRDDGENAFFCHSYYFSNPEERRKYSSDIRESLVEYGHADFFSFHMITCPNGLSLNHSCQALSASKVLTMHFHENWGSKELQLQDKLHEQELTVRIGNELSHDLFNRLGDIRTMLSHCYDHFDEAEYDRLEEMIRVAERSVEKAIGIPWLTRYKNKPENEHSIWDTDIRFKRKMGEYWENHFISDIQSILIGEGRAIKYGGKKFKHLDVSVLFTFSFDHKGKTFSNTRVLSVRDYLGDREPVWDTTPIWPLAFIKNTMVDKDGQKAIFTYANNELIRNAVRFGIANLEVHKRKKYPIEVTVNLHTNDKKIVGSVSNFIAKNEITTFVRVIEDKLKHMGCGYTTNIQTVSDADGNSCIVDWTLHLDGRRA